MKCDECGAYLLYWRQIVEVSPAGDGLHALETEEKTRPSRDLPAASGKYHPDCYAAARERDDRLPTVRLSQERRDPQAAL
jgi:hypothetical protein